MLQGGIPELGDGRVVAIAWLMDLSSIKFQSKERIIQLPSVAGNDFLNPIEAHFGELKAGERNVLYALIYQCKYGFLRYF